MAGEASIETQTRSLAGIETCFRFRAGQGTPTVFAHGNPTDGADWLPFMEAMRTPVLAMDMPGFGRSERPSHDRFDGSMHALADWFGRALEELAVDHHNLVVHDWGGLALIAAQRRPALVERVVLIDAVPLLRGYRWHWIARIWRRRGLGELFTRLTTKPALRQLSRQARPGLKPLPDEYVDRAWEAWDEGMRRAVLRLYRSADPAVLEAGGAHLDRLDGPALVLWGANDPYVGSQWADAYSDALTAAASVEVEVLEEAGHWPWLDRPELIDRVVEFLEERRS